MTPSTQLSGDLLSSGSQKQPVQTVPAPSHPCECRFESLFEPHFECGFAQAYDTTITYLSDKAFWRIHNGWHRSPEAKALRQRLYAKQNGRCARCSKPLGWRYELNLTSYDRMKQGLPVREEDANLLHHGCHKKGRYSWQKIRSDKQTDRQLRWLNAFFDLLLWLARKLIRGLLSLWRLAVRRLRQRLDQ